MRTDLAIIVPCRNDPRVIDCVASAGKAVEILIVFNGSTSEFREWVVSQVPHEVRTFVVDEANLSLALECGSRAAHADWLLYMDSDCTFAPGAVDAFRRRMERGRPDAEVYKGPVRFSPGRSWISRVIARSRQHHTADELTAYKPPLAVSRAILSKIGGSFFNPSIRWREDADLDHRIRNAGIAIVDVRDGLIHHAALDLRTDLRSTFRYGSGEAMALLHGVRLTDVPRSVLTTLRSQGVAPALYMLFRNRVYTAGYLKGLLTARSPRVRRIDACHARELARADSARIQQFGSDFSSAAIRTESAPHDAACVENASA